MCCSERSGAAVQLTAAKGLAPLRRSPVLVGVLGVLFSHSGPDALLRAGSQPIKERTSFYGTSGFKLPSSCTVFPSDNFSTSSLSPRCSWPEIVLLLRRRRSESVLIARPLNPGYQNYYVGCPTTSFQIFAKSAISRVAALDLEEYDGGDRLNTAGSAQGVY